MPNFGRDTIAGAGGTLPNDWKKFVKFMAPSDITEADSISAYLNRTATGGQYAVKGGIYTDNAGAPDALVPNSEIVIDSNISRNSPQWYSIDYVTKPALTPSAVYWIGVQTNKNITTFYDAGGTNQTALKADEYTTLDDPFGTPSYIDQEHSFYVSYTTGLTTGFNKLVYTSEPPTPNAWNQVKREAGTGWRKLLYT